MSYKDWVEAVTAAIEVENSAGTLPERRLEIAMYGIKATLEELKNDNFIMARKRLVQIVRKIESMT